MRAAGRGSRPERYPELEVDLDHQSGESVAVEEDKLLGDILHDKPTTGVAAQDLDAEAFEVVGKRQGWTVQGAAQYGDLARGPPKFRIGSRVACTLMRREPCPTLLCPVLTRCPAS